MYRCITELKGLIIDIESFMLTDVEEWADVVENYKCVFYVSNPKKAKELAKLYGENSIYEIKIFLKFFAPSPKSHEEVLARMQLRATEIAYVSCNRQFLNNASCFFGGTIWVTEEINYEDASKAPDLICRGFAAFKRLIKNNVAGFLGEVAVFPNDDTRGMIIPFMFETEKAEFPIYMLGRYFGYSHYMSQMHPYSSAIFLNKKEDGKAFGKYNDLFIELYVCAIEKIQKSYRIDGVVSVPTRPMKKERFKGILETISARCNIKNYGDRFRCVKDYANQKSLSAIDRQENISGVFQCDKYFKGKNIILIDDIVTTGATIRECIDELKRAGAGDIYIVVLAINQLEGSYWTSNQVQISCPVCGEKMHLLVNSRDLSFFYSCYSCRNSTLGFDEAREELVDMVNKEFKL